jgi:hypothetical protein
MKKLLFVLFALMVSQSVNAAVSDDAKSILKKTIERLANDPDSIKYRDLRSAHPDGACVEFNAKNQFGGYAGYKEVCVYIQNGQVSYSRGIIPLQMYKDTSTYYFQSSK